MSTSMASLVGGVSFTLLLSLSDHIPLSALELGVALVKFDVSFDLDSGVFGTEGWDLNALDGVPAGLFPEFDFASAGFPKKLMRLFCFMSFGLGGIAD